MNDCQCLYLINQGGAKALEALQSLSDRYHHVIMTFIDLRYSCYGITHEDGTTITRQVFANIQERLGSQPAPRRVLTLRPSPLPTQEAFDEWFWGLVLACANDYVRTFPLAIKEEELPDSRTGDTMTLLCFLALGGQPALWAFDALYNRYVKVFAAYIRKRYPQLKKEDIEDILHSTFVKIWQWGTQGAEGETNG